MRTETKTRTLYKFDELPEDIKEKAIEKLSDINVDYEWWDYIYEDAKNIGLEITSFDLDRNRHAKGKFIKPSDVVIQEIEDNHGKECETYKTAMQYKQAFIDFRYKTQAEDCPMSVYDAFEDTENDFLKSLLEDYSIMLQKELDYKQSSEAIKETIECNDYEFDDKGNLA